ncbi:MAG: hypothetical protein LRY67_06625 [Gammaproteobacteria bacterium]|nr:hypothetical protein [Gammaproteobacteria bacterium]
MSGFKHLLVPCMLATFGLSSSNIILTNVPEILDKKILCEIMEYLGCIIHQSQDTLTINTTNACSKAIPEHLTDKIHGAIYLLPVLLGRFKKIDIGGTGGCAIGDESLTGKRPISHMLSILKKFGAKFSINGRRIEGSCSRFTAQIIDIMNYSERSDILTGPLVSGATKTAILASLFVTEGMTTILNPYQKPDVIFLVDFIKSYGFRTTLSKDAITIMPPDYYISSPAPFRLCADVSQIMTYIALSVYHKIQVVMENVDWAIDSIGLKHELTILNSMGITLCGDGGQLTVSSPMQLRKQHIIVTSESIYSDHQPLFAIMLTHANGVSKIEEHVWKKRFAYVSELNRLGFKMHEKNNELIIEPSGVRCGGTLLATDLRTAACLLIAALNPPETVILNGLEHLERGYESLVEQLLMFGFQLE